MTTWRAPTCRAIAAAMMPIGPAPVISTSSPTSGNDSAVCVALPNGSKIDARSSPMSSGILNALNAGITRYSANAPSRLTPTPTVLRHRWRRPARQLRQKPQVMCPSPETRSPMLEAAHLLPHLDDLADVFVADLHRHGNRLLRPVVPLPDVDVGAADRGLADPDHHVVVPDLGLLDVGQARARARARAWPMPSSSSLPSVAFDHRIAPSSRPTLPKAATAWSICASVCAALICVRMRALPFGTTGYEKPIT